jgi:anti-sigma regulatory factor (Ser/Thr protein kinase)
MKPHEFALPVPASPPAVTDARHRAVKAIGHWGGELDAEVLQTAELVLSELLTNAVQHAGTGRISLMLRRLPDAVRMAATRRQASGRENTPATWAAASSPTEWPMRWRGR